MGPVGARTIPEFKIPIPGDVGSPEQGRQLIFAYGCGMCHIIPGIPGARYHVGPPLEGIAVRSYVAGVLVNLPENLIEFVMDPPAFNPNTAMPNLGVTHDQARHIAAYLYTLR
jgi:cytochrome c